MTYRAACDRLRRVIATAPGRVRALKVSEAEFAALWPPDQPRPRPGEAVMFREIPLVVVGRR